MSEESPGKRPPKNGPPEKNEAQYGDYIRGVVLAWSPMRGARTVQKQMGSLRKRTVSCGCNPPRRRGGEQRQDEPGERAPAAPPGAGGGVAVE